MSDEESTANDEVSAESTLIEIREGQEAEMGMITRCRTDIRETSTDDRLSPAEAQTRVRQLQRLRAHANQALRDLEDDERSMVANSEYARDTVEKLRAATAALLAEVRGTRAIAGRANQVAGVIDRVADAADAVLSRVLPA